ncbi:MAG: glutamate--tRNA ligase [Candidatus Ratteibacteria bacterium]|nr:glutamate--tRNA ligase [Candidatus Ratteibacteria bacterium]
MVRVRFAPSPTGFLHIGGARTALFNWLFAKHNKGKFILRIEDTDLTRSTKEAELQILDSLKWMGLDWDEGPLVGGPHAPYYQSQRLEIYKKFIDKLLKEGKAYPCYCSGEELDARREEMKKKGEVPRYDGRCRNLTDAEQNRLKKEGRKEVVRFKWTTPVRPFKDAIHGEINFGEHQYDDFVILKADGSPTYNFSCVVDDHTMEITHVIRGDDHITNTPRQIAIYEALGFNPPQFAHIPLILGPDKSRLSKRHGAVGVLEYKKEGYLPEALMNFISLLGWSPGNNKEIMSQEELIRSFSLERIISRNAVFNKEKLDWMNGAYLKTLPTEKLLEHLMPYLKEAGFVKDKTDRIMLMKIVEIYKPRIRTLQQIVDNADFLFKDELKYDEDAVNKFLKRDYVPSLLEKVGKRLEALKEFEPQAIEATLRKLAEELNMKGGDFIHPLRVALTGKEVSPPLFDVIGLLGKEKTIKRIKETRKLL